MVQFPSFPIHVFPTDSTFPSISSIDLFLKVQRARAVLSTRPALIQVNDFFILWDGIARVWIGGQAKLQAFALILCGKYQLRRTCSKSVALPISPHYLWHLELKLLAQPGCHIPKHPIFQLLEHKDWDRCILVILAPSPYEAVES